MHDNARAKEVEKDRTTISRLYDHDLVQSQAEGRRNVYSLKRPELIEKFLELHSLLRR